MATQLDVLKGARERIEAGWCRDTQHKVIAGKDHFCLLGAVADASVGAGSQVQDAALRRVSDAIPTPNYFDSNTRVRIWRWNDFTAKSKRQVLKVLDAAIAEAEKRAK